MDDLSRFAEYYKLADVLVEKAGKEELAECARLPDDHWILFLRIA